MMIKILKTMLLSIVLILAVLIPAAYADESVSGKKPIIVDVRTESEWVAGHLEGAVLIPYERIGDEISKVASDKKEQIYLYCRSGRRTGIAEKTLKNAGYENLINLETMENASRILNRNVVK
jgi:phage shock protein E